MNVNLNDKWKIYTIMHLNRRVASISKDGSCVIYNKTFMPFNLYLENAEDNDLDIRLNNLSNFYYWCSSRVLSLDRKYAKEILNSLGMKQAVTDKDRAEIAISYHALSLTDVYWVKAFRETVVYEDINLFDHSLSDSFIDVCLCGKSLTIQNYDLNSSEYAASISAQGVAPKAWVRKKDGFHLYKDGNLAEVKSEILASKLIDCFDVAHVRYKSSVYTSEGKEYVVSDSKIITSEKYSIVPFEYVSIYALNNNKDVSELINEIDQYSYYMMNIVDYLIGNTDRHWGNWGVLVDNANNKMIGLHPLMDFNKSFLSYDSIDGANCLTVLKGNPMSQKDAAIEAVQKIGLNQISEIDYSLFDDKKYADMFKNRLEILRKCI